MPNETGQARSSGADTARYARLWILFAVTQFPVTIAIAALIALGSRHVTGYWWVVVPLAAEILPGAAYWRTRRLAPRPAADQRTQGAPGTLRPR